MPDISRRTLLKLLLGVSAVLAVAPLSALTRYFDVPYVFTPTKQLIRGASDLPKNSAINFQWPTLTRPFDSDVLVKDANGRYNAFNRVCTHLQCMTNYDPGSETIQCPCHGSIYDARTGEVTSGPAPRALPIIDLEVGSDGEVYAVSSEGAFGYGNVPTTSTTRATGGENR